MKESDYYIPPSQEIFEDVKANVLSICKAYQFSQEKIDQIDCMENIRDNCAYMVAMFDSINQARLLIALKPESRKWLGKIIKNN